MSATVPSHQQYQQFHTRGYYIARGVVESDRIGAIREALLAKATALAASRAYASDKILEGVAKTDPDAIPLHERFRKLNALDDLPAVWNGWLAHPQVLAHVRGFLGPDILDKYASAFLKPAKVGGATPWHQDIGLWRDGNSTAINAWLAIDPATVENGCLQVVPGSHKGPVIEHVTYPDSVHAELPRERCQNLQVDQIELQPGDAVFWHSHLWHYSPPNSSEHGRIGCGAVWISPAQLGDLRMNRLRWAMRRGVALAHPAPHLIVEQPVESPAPAAVAQAAY
jgi:phytanoyl-CoA hydroxylase